MIVFPSVNHLSLKIYIRDQENSLKKTTEVIVRLTFLEYDLKYDVGLKLI